ncbi:flagellar motor switch protein FliN [Psychromonas sp. Urea-02u-13]|uniref:flagellar motor switch protein FliN n=1 Tax=Psychromonas sp. Urea-02u-13 TaxID=2058326 RepID=UPI000C324F41|nr:flagellar motor switch protein FliN [Psychromonas sp. Urea-02u-13]PKG39555.1 flagellar motor switch protein FliN [Psychromonas sp. Urea-02u-13]
MNTPVNKTNDELITDDLNFEDMNFNFEDDDDKAIEEKVTPSETVRSMEFLNDIPVKVTVEVGAKTVDLSELLSIKSNSILMLNKENGEALDIKVNGKLFAYGEVVVSGGHYGVKVTDIVNEYVK